MCVPVLFNKQLPMLKYYNVIAKGYNSGINNFAQAFIKPITTISEKAFASGTIFTIAF